MRPPIVGALPEAIIDDAGLTQSLRAYRSTAGDVTASPATSEHAVVLWPCGPHGRDVPSERVLLPLYVCCTVLSTALPNSHKVIDRTTSDDNGLAQVRLECGAGGQWQKC